MSTEREFIDRQARAAVEELHAQLDSLQQNVYALDSRIAEYHDVNRRTFNLLVQRDAEDEKRAAARQLEEDRRWLWTQATLAVIVLLLIVIGAIFLGAQMS